MMASKQGVSALTLQRVTELGSYQSAWTMTHKLRSVMHQSGRDRLLDRVEMDETFICGDRHGTFGRGAAGKTLVAGAIERRGTGFGRARLQTIPDASSARLAGFIRTHVSAGATLITDGWPPYPPAAAAAGVAIKVHNIKASGQPAHPSLPGVHLVFSLTKQDLEGTYQGSVQPEHLQTYLDEFVFRFNRRTSHTRGLLFFWLLESAVAGPPAPTRAWPSSTASQKAYLSRHGHHTHAAHTRRNTARTSLASPTNRIITAVTWIANICYFVRHEGHSSHRLAE